MGWYTTATITFTCENSYVALELSEILDYKLNEKGNFETGFDNKRYINENDIFNFIDNQMSDIKCKKKLNCLIKVIKIYYFIDFIEGELLTEFTCVLTSDNDEEYGQFYLKLNTEYLICFEQKKLIIKK